MAKRRIPDLPQTLIDAVREQRAILFLGAGASLSATDADGRQMPGATDLAAVIADTFLSAKFRNRDLMRVSELAASQAGKNVFHDWLKNFFSPFEPTEAHTLMPSFRWRMVVTTNYDQLVEKAYDRAVNGAQTLVKRVKDAEPFDLKLQQHAAPLEFLKLHGCIEHVHDPQIPLILTPETYLAHDVNRRHLYGRLEELSAVHPVIFCGHSLTDPHIRRLVEDGDRSARPIHYLVTPEFENEERMLWAERRVEVVKATFADLMAALEMALPPMLRIPRPNYSAIDKPYRRHFRVHQEESDRLAVAFAEDLQLLHATMPLASATAERFYSGHEQGWGSIRRGFDVFRRASRQLLDFVAETANSGAQLAVLRGAAGFGKSIALRRAAWALAVDLDEIVIWVDDDGRVWPDVLQELHDLTGKRIHLFIDRAAFNLETIVAALDAAKAKDVPLTLVTAERANEWSIYCQRLEKHRPSFFEVKRLSAREAEELIEKLEEHGCLGALEREIPERRMEIITQKLDRQLLVILHEITKGVPFETIIADEFKRVSPPEAQELYLDICTLNRFDVPVRAGVVSRISGISFRDFETEFFEPLEGLITTNRHAVSGDYEYRARHPLVGEIVFTQACRTDEQRRDQIVRVIDALDLGFQADKIALSGLLRGRALADTFDSIELAREVYDLAALRNPQAAFVGQQRAILELTHSLGDLQKAQAAIDAALALDPDNPTLKTTRAQVLRRRSRDASSDFARDTLRNQARQQYADLTDQNDPYVLSGRARLRVDEVEDAVRDVRSRPTDARKDRLAEAVDQAELALTRAFNAHPNDPDLLQTKARLRELLGEFEESTQLLQRAFDRMTRGSGLGKRLARRYIDRGQNDKALEVLGQAVERNPTDRSLRLLIADILFRRSGQLDDPTAVEHLRASFVSGDREHLGRFVCAAHAFVRRDYDLSEKLFRDIDDRAPAEFQPILSRMDEVGSWLNGWLSDHRGKIQRSFGSYMFVAMPGYPRDVYAPATESDEASWDALKVNDAVAFDLDFNRRGPFCKNVSPVNPN